MPKATKADTISGRNDISHVHIIKLMGKPAYVMHDCNLRSDMCPCAATIACGTLAVRSVIKRDTGAFQHKKNKLSATLCLYISAIERTVLVRW